MKYLGSAAVVALSLFAFSTGASAAVACNGEGDCWRTPHREYPGHAGIHVYDDEWEPGEGYASASPATVVATGAVASGSVSSPGRLGTK